MSILAPFPDIEVAVMAWLRATFPELETVNGVSHVGSTAVAEDPTQYPFVRVGKIGGNDDLITDRPLVDIEVFDRSRMVSYTLSEAIRARLLGFPHRVNGVVIDRVGTVVSPWRAPWEDSGIHRYLATYQFSARR
jgi:hypothetical protein